MSDPSKPVVADWDGWNNPRRAKIALLLVAVTSGFVSGSLRSVVPGGPVASALFVGLFVLVSLTAAGLVVARFD